MLDFESKGVDVVLLKKLIKSQLLDIQSDLWKKVKDDYDPKLLQLLSQNKQLANKITPLQDLIQL